jgi:hypothetical protein
MPLTPNHKLAILCGLIAIPTAIMAWVKLTAHDDRRGARLAEDDGFLRYFPDVDDDDARDALRRYARDQASLKEEQMEAERKAAALADIRAKQRALALSELFDPTRPGAPGLLFEGLRLDEPWIADADMTARFERFRSDTGAEITVGHDEITVHIPSTASRTAADELRTAANAAWQPGDQDHWIDPAAHVRASLQIDPDDAYLYFQRAITLDELFPADADTDSALLPAIGAPADFTPPLGAHVDPSSGGFYYLLPSIRWSYQDPVNVYVDTAHDRVTAIHVRTGAHTDDELQEVTAALRARYGVASPSPHAAGAFDERWRAGKLAITTSLSYSGELVVDVTRAR